MTSARSSETLAGRDSTPQSKDRESSTDQFEKYGVHIEDDNKVRWNDGARDHPRNWSPWSKYYSAAIISWLELYMTGISTSGTAAANAAREEYGMSRTLAYFAFVSLYLIGQTIGGIFCSPISEAFGRRTIYIIATAMFCVTSIVVAAVPSDMAGAVSAIYIGRFLQGVAAAIPATVAFGNFEDMFDAEKRIWVVYSYTLSGMIGLVMGPIYSSYVLARTNWYESQQRTRQQPLTICTGDGCFGYPLSYQSYRLPPVSSSEKAKLPSYCKPKLRRSRKKQGTII